MSGTDEAAEGVADDPGGDEGCDLGGVVRRRALDHFHAGQRLLRYQLDELQHFAWKEAAWFWLAGAGHERRVEAVDIEAEPDGVDVFRVCDRKVAEKLSYVKG